LPCSAGSRTPTNCPVATMINVAESVRKAAMEELLKRRKVLRIERWLVSPDMTAELYRTFIEGKPESVKYYPEGERRQGVCEKQPDGTWIIVEGKHDPENYAPVSELSPVERAQRLAAILLAGKGQSPEVDNLLAGGIERANELTHEEIEREVGEMFADYTNTDRGTHAE
jgi:hypothetical protein